MNIWILHAGINHPSPYFYNLCNELKKYEDVNVIINPELPTEKSQGKNILYFNRLKRFYDSNDLKTAELFLSRIDELKKSGWIMAFTLHNFFPIDREITYVDLFVTKEFLNKMDIVFTFTKYMQKELLKNYKIKSIVHSIGINKLDDKFDRKVIDLSNIKQSDFVFTFIGNIAKYKMIEEFITAFSEIENQNIKFIIAGPLGKNYKLEINDSRIIIYDEFIGDSDWYSLCQKTNIFINSYDTTIDNFKNGFFPSSCIQIASNKKICLAPKSRIITELLPKGFYYEYNGNDKKHLKEVLESIILKKEEIIEKEKKYPEINNSWKDTVAIIIREFRKYE